MAFAATVSDELLFLSFHSVYQGSDRSLHLRSKTKWKPSTFSVVKVLNYFSCVQKNAYKKAKCVKAAKGNNTALLPLRDWYVKSKRNKIPVQTVVF